MGSPDGCRLRQMEATHAIVSRKHLRHQQISVPNLNNRGCSIQRFQNAQVHRCDASRHPNVCNGWKAAARLMTDLGGSEGFKPQ